MNRSSVHNKDLFVIIMAGGEGTRFAPLSTPERPKQFLNFIGEKTFVRQTYERVLPLVDAENIYVSTNARYVELVKEQIPEILNKNIIGEPKKKNTAPALVFATLQIARKNPNATIICLPSDHYIKEDDKFREILLRAVNLAHDNYLVTLGMHATWASPEYGYIAPSSNALEWSTVKKFIEKPTSEVASQYMRDGYYWNGGIFIWKSKTFLEEVKKYAPELIPSKFLVSIEGNGQGDGEAFSLSTYFDSVPSISIDYAVMEKSNRVAVIPTNVGWSDIGTWESLRRLWKNESLHINETVIDVMNRSLGFVKSVDVNAPTRIEKPWGYEEIWAHTEEYVGKLLVIKSAQRLSYQYHNVKEETIRILSGVMDFEYEASGERKMIRLSAGDSFHIPPKTRHRMSAVEDCHVLEVSTPFINDVVRVEDDFGRVVQKK